MAKTKTVFYCQKCGANSPKWIGKCPSCNEWNTYVEEVIQAESKENQWRNTTRKESKAAKPRLISEIALEQSPRLVLPDGELNRVLGGGIVPGSLILIGGEPGIGKSTLLLQLAVQLKGKKILYISGEESEQQIRMRAERIGKMQSECYILTETTTQNIFQQIEVLQPEMVIVDSIQTLYSNIYESAPGTVSQIRGCTGELLRFAKETATPVLLIGHITKEGSIAGPKVLEHMVDTVLQFEGDRHHVYRILRAIKNRFGSTAELGIYEMKGDGLAEVANPSALLLSQRDASLSGTAVACTMEGVRPFLIETQALVSSAVYGTPQRTTTGYDLRRLHMILAVLEKRCGFRLAAKDVFLNIAGGIRVEDPAIDLAIICAILSSAEDIAIDPAICFAGEVGLTGEIRPVNRIEARINEAARLGFKEIYVSGYNAGAEKLKKEAAIKVVPVGKVEEVFGLLFG
ncbi:MAG: DNA repair protein RadA [Bacteroidetes bacterium]|jgi:DNA repair protein RadA/Sms|nr:DNA repair protein RadA [Bacteroidota bacterium]